MLVIRLTRIGKKNAPAYRVVLAEKHKSVKGKFIEILGHYNPRLKTKGLDAEKIKYWISKGAQPSPTVHNLLVSEKIIEAKKIKAWQPKKKTVEARKVKKAEAAKAAEENKTAENTKTPAAEEKAEAAGVPEEKIETAEVPAEK